MAYSNERRQGARSGVQWALLYAGEDLIGQGTIINISSVGCRVAGNMPASVGMTLKMWVWPAQRDEALGAVSGRVLWVRQQEFGLVFEGLASHDQQWLQNYLDTAERRDSFRNVAAGVDQTSADGLSAKD